MEKTIQIYCLSGVSGFPFRVLIDGKKEPRNRDFEDRVDVRRTYRELQDAGFYKGYVIVE